MIQLLAIIQVIINQVYKGFIPFLGTSFIWLLFLGRKSSTEISDKYPVLRKKIGGALAILTLVWLIF